MRKSKLFILIVPLLALGGLGLLMGCLTGSVLGALPPTPTALTGPPDAQSTTGPTPPPGVDPAVVSAASADAVVIVNVPAYLWRHGCGPTAAGMVIGYWDGRGFDDLVPGDASSQTDAVNAMIASGGPASNYTDYCEPIDSYPDLKPDRSEPPVGDEHPDNCVADYMKTSQSFYYNYYGWSWFSAVGPAMKNYVDALGQDGYDVTVNNLYMVRDSSLNWDSFRAEIDAGRPMVLLVDTDGNGGTDHFVTAVGYDEEAGVKKYACLDTWSAGLRWCEFASMAEGQEWGIFGGVTFQIEGEGPPKAVEISGPTKGFVQANYAYAAAVSPITATQPIIFVWQATGQPPVTHTRGVIDTVSFVWNTPGVQAITVTAANDWDVVTDTHLITLSTVAPERVTISDWTTVVVQASYVFYADVSPVTTTTPITYAWQATGQNTPITHTGGVSDEVRFSWDVTGPQTVAVTATNFLSSVTDTLHLNVIKGHKVYLPLVLRRHS